MTWLRIDDSFIDHPKLVSLGGAAQRWAFLELLTYCAKHKTEGYFPVEISDTHRRITPAFLDKCVAVGLVDRSAAGELRVHDFGVYNPVKDMTGAARQQRWRNANVTPSTVTEPVTESVTRNGPVTENVTGVVTPSRARDPVPSPTTSTNNLSLDADAEEAELDRVNKLLAQVAPEDIPW